MNKKIKVLLSVVFLLVLIFGFSSFIMYNSYDAVVSKDFKTIKYNDVTYIQTETLPKDCIFDKQIKAFQAGNSLYSQWLVAPMCKSYISNDGIEYIEIITENDTVDNQTIYYKSDNNMR